VQDAGTVASFHRHVGGAAVALDGTGVSRGFSIDTDHGAEAPAAIDVGAVRAVAVSDLVVFPDGSVKFTVTGKGLTMTAAGELLVTLPVTVV